MPLAARSSLTLAFGLPHPLRAAGAAGGLPGHPRVRLQGVFGEARVIAIVSRCAPGPPPLPPSLLLPHPFPYCTLPAALSFAARDRLALRARHATRPGSGRGPARRAPPGRPLLTGPAAPSRIRFGRRRVRGDAPLEYHPGAGERLAPPANASAPDDCVFDIVFRTP